MDADGEVAPAVRSILRAAERREVPPGGPIAVDARPLGRAIESAAGGGRVPVIAEVKPTSPTTSSTRSGDPVELARAMVEGGAAAVSVLTEPSHFGGSASALERVRDAVDVPVLRKDFVLTSNHLDLVAADVVLLIARFVDDLSGLMGAARSRGFQVLVEVHTPAEFREAVAAGARFVGVNNRDLARLEVDLGTVELVLGAVTVPDDVVVVAESGIATSADVRRMLEAGADAMLIGTAIMDGDVRANTTRLTDAAP